MGLILISLFRTNREDFKNNQTIKFRLIFVTLFLLGCRANDCFGPCEISSYGSGGRISTTRGVTLGENHNILNHVVLTNYHCIMKCAHKLTKVTMALALDDLHEKFNARCIMIENLDYCVQYWKQLNEVDCEEPIKDMVRQNFQSTWDDNCYNDYVNGDYISKFQNVTLN